MEGEVRGNEKRITLYNKYKKIALTRIESDFFVCERSESREKTAKKGASLKARETKIPVQSAYQSNLHSSMCDIIQ